MKMQIAKENPAYAPCTVSVTLPILACGTCMVISLPFYSVYGNIIRYDPTLVDLTSNFFVLCSKYQRKSLFYLYN